jgi:caa(3)-type oxidase subunit IV
VTWWSLTTNFCISHLPAWWTIAINFVPLGTAHLWVGLGIAMTKTIVVVLVFMGLTRTTGAARLAASASILWLSFAILLVMADYLTRGWDETQEHELKKGDRYTTYDRVEYSVPHETPKTQ